MTYVSKQRGATIVEMAVLLSVFLMIVFGIVEFGRAVWYYNTVGHAAREGTRFAAVNGSTSGAPPGPRDSAVVTPLVRSKVISAAVGLNLQTGDIVVTWSPNNKPGSTVSVEVTKAFVPVTPYIGIFTIKRSSSLTIVR